MKIAVVLCEEDIGGVLYADGTSVSTKPFPYETEWRLTKNGRKQFFTGKVRSSIGMIEIPFVLPYRFHKMVKSNPEGLYKKLFGMIPPNRIEGKLAELKQQLVALGGSL